MVGLRTVTDPALYNQIHNVLKLVVGEPVILFNATGVEAMSVIATIEKKSLTVNIVQVRASTAEPARFVSLYLAILKNEHFEWAAQKAVECGVSEIIPIVTSRTVKLALKMDRVVKIIKEAAEQSGRVVVPRLAEPMAFADAMTQAVKYNTENVLCDGEGTGRVTPRTDRVGVWIGPEGGFHPEEIGAGQKAGFVTASLGPLTLRAETAAIIATYLAARG